MIESHPFATLQQITAGYIVSRCLHVVADLGVADVLDETPRTAAELATRVRVGIEVRARGEAARGAGVRRVPAPRMRGGR